MTDNLTPERIDAAIEDLNIRGWDMPKIWLQEHVETIFAALELARKFKEKPLLENEWLYGEICKEPWPRRRITVRGLIEAHEKLRNLQDAHTKNIITVVPPTEGNENDE